MKLRLLGIALVSLASAGAAAAADLPLKAPPPPVPVWSWTGFYVGGNVGYSWGRATTDFGESATSTSVITATTSGGGPLPGNGATSITSAFGTGSASSSLDGWLAGVQAGYNWQVQEWVLGLEADIQATGEQDDPLFCASPGCPAGTLFGTSSTKLPWFATVRGRVGHTFDLFNRPNSLLLYATGGLAIAEIDASFAGGLVGGPLGFISSKTTNAGWTVGAGGEGRIGDSNWTLKLEYLYMDLGDVSGAFGVTGAPVTLPFGINNSDQIHRVTTTTAIASAASTHVTDQILRIGLNYKFP